MLESSRSTYTVPELEAALSSAQGLPCLASAWSWRDARLHMHRDGLACKALAAYGLHALARPGCRVLCSQPWQMQVRKLLDAAYGRAKGVLRDHERDLHLLADTLLEKETLSGKQILDMLPSVPARAAAAVRGPAASL